jgi:hypothetical protein
MPISTSLYTELRFTISDFLQRGDWARLFGVCGTEDDETARTIGVIMSGFDSDTVWQFLGYALKLERSERIEKASSIATICYVLGRMGQTNVKKTLSTLRQFLDENPDLEGPVSVALSNMWVLNPRKTSAELQSSWILGAPEALQEAAVASCEYLLKNDPSEVSEFLESVKKSQEKGAAQRAKELVKRYLPEKSEKRKKKKHDKKKHKHKKKHGKKRKKKHKKRK